MSQQVFSKVYRPAGRGVSNAGAGPRPRLRQLVVALGALVTAGALAAPQDGVVRAGSATITASGASTLVQQSSARAVIDWRSFSIAAGEQVRFAQPSAGAAVLNRVTGDQVSVLLGRLDANGQVFLVNPNGVFIGRGGQVNVASFLATTANVGNDNFMANRLVFDQPGKLGAGIVNAGSISAAEGGLVALVAPHVRNDGLIQARLGKVTLASGDRFTVDLYGDQLLQLALSDSHAGQLIAPDGQAVRSLIDNSGAIVAGQAVLVTAATARHVLDNLINLSGTVKAASAVEDGGRIVLLGEGGTVAVSGQLEASGRHGGSIEVLGQAVRLAGSASINADGAEGGGRALIGGAFQGGGSTYRAQTVDVAAGARVSANALGSGNGGEVVVWSDGHTQFAGTVEARGGALAGNGGRLEVSGKNTLDFGGMADASAPRGVNGTLLLDPATLDIGAADAGLISRVLRTGTSTTLQASEDININAVIDGRGYFAGGGLTLDAGRALNINDYVITHNGAVNLLAGSGGVTVAAGKAVYSGSAPLSVRGGGTLAINGALLTSASLDLVSRAGSVALNQWLDNTTGPVTINAALDVDLYEPITSHANGNALHVSAGQDLRVNAQIDGRGLATGGAVRLEAGRNVALNSFVLSNDGAITVTAGGTVSSANGAGLVAGNAPVTVTGGGNVVLGPVLSNAAIAVRSTGASVNFGGTLLDGQSGAVTITAAGAVDISAPIVNARAAAPLVVTAGGNINVNAQIDGRDGNAALPGGSVTLLAGNGITLNQSIVTENAALTLTATSGALTTASGQGVFAGAGAIALTSGASLSTGAIVTTGSITARSTGGALNMNTAFTDPATLPGALTFAAATDVNINQPIANTRSLATLSVTAGNDINVDALIDGRDANAGSAGGTVSLTAARNVNLNQSITTENAALGVTTTTGTLVAAAGKGLFAGNAPLTVSTGGTLNAGILATSGALSLTSTAGGINLTTGIPDTVGSVTMNAATTVNIDQPIVNIKNGSNLAITAGTDINVNQQIDGRGGAGASGTISLTAAGNLNVNNHITSKDAVINLTTTGGSVVLAPGKQVRSGSAALNITSGGDFSTGAAPPVIPAPPADINTPDLKNTYVANFLKDYVQLVTTGALNVTSTNGSVFVDAPIPDSSGAVTISAGNAIDVRQHINSNNQPIVLNGGTGGIILRAVEDDCGAGNCEISAAVDARGANLTMNSIGDVIINNGEAATAKTLTIDTRGQLMGNISYSRSSIDPTSIAPPERVFLTADAGIPSFNIGPSGIQEITATSINGSINLGVFLPRKLRITTGCLTCDIAAGGFLGPDVIFNAGGDINLGGDTSSYLSGTPLRFTMIAGRDINAGALDVYGASFAAGRDVRFGRDVGSAVFINGGGLPVTAGRDIITTATSPIHIGSGAALNFQAGRNVTLYQLEALGAVNITATTGSITLNEPLGPEITPSFDPNPNHKGVASVMLNAPVGPIAMTGAWAQGNINISTGGNLVSTREIVSVNGTVTYNVTGTKTLSATPIGTQAEMVPPAPVLPVGPPGPLVPPPGAPGTASVGAPGLPGFPDIVIAGLPGSSGGSIGLPGGADGAIVALPGTAADSEGDGNEALAAQRAAQQSTSNEASGEGTIILADGGEMVFTGGGTGAGLATVPCPPGVASGTSVRVRGAGGQERAAVCR